MADQITREKNKKKMASWRKRNPEKARASYMRYKWKNIDKVRERDRIIKRNRWGAFPTRPEPTLCECCGKPPGRRSLDLDHDHITGRFRGWLCVNCNSGIGKLGDTVHGLRRAIDYLEISELL